MQLSFWTCAIEIPGWDLIGTSGCQEAVLISGTLCTEAAFWKSGHVLEHSQAPQGVAHGLVPLGTGGIFTSLQLLGNPSYAHYMGYLCPVWTLLGTRWEPGGSPYSPPQ